MNAFSFHPPSITGRLAGWWSAWKWVLILLLILAASIAANVWQWKRAITAPLRAEVAAKDKALDDTEAMNAQMRARALELLEAADITAGTMQQAGKDYRAAVARRPLTAPICAPGQGRVDAVNRALGAQPTGEKRGTK